MNKYSVRVTSSDGTYGVGPVEISARSEKYAKSKFLTNEGVTEEDLTSDGLTVWTVTEVA